MTGFGIAATPARMGRRKQWAEDMQARFAEGTFDRITSVLKDGEDRTAFVREAVEREIQARERRLAKAIQTHPRDAGSR